MPYSILSRHGPNTPAPAAPGQDPTAGIQKQEVLKPLDLSVGITLEFFAALKNISFNRTGHENLRHLIGHEMTRRRTQGAGGKLAQIHVPSEQELHGSEGSGMDYPPGSWIITRDTTIEPDHPEWFDDFELQPIKLIAPVYHGRGHWDEFETDLAGLLRPVSNPDDEADIYCELNTSTHFHVQIGNVAGDGGFELPTVQRLAILVLAFEKMIDKMLADHMGYICESLWAGSQRNNPAFRGLSLSASCHRILRECKTIEDVADMMCPQVPRSPNPKLRHFYKYNFMSLLTKKRTIEFRQHEGTLDADEIIRWVWFVGGLVDLAHRIDIQNLSRLAHLNDSSPVSYTELCAAMVAYKTVPTQSNEDVLWYMRKIHGRGGPRHTSLSMTYKSEASQIAWREIQDGEKTQGIELD